MILVSEWVMSVIQHHFMGLVTAMLRKNAFVLFNLSYQ